MNSKRKRKTTLSLIIILKKRQQLKFVTKHENEARGFHHIDYSKQDEKYSTD